MGIEYSPKAKKKARNKSKRANNRLTQAGPVTVRKADGTTTILPALEGSVTQVKKR